MTDIKGIENYIAENSTEKARAFSMRIIPTSYPISGMQSPAAKELTKRVKRGDYGTPEELLCELPDTSYELLGLKGAIIAFLKISLDKKAPLIREFVAKIDNWATNDSFVSAINIPKNERKEYFQLFSDYAKGEGEYVIRFGVTGLMDNYLDDDHIDKVLEIVKGITDSAYYVKMAVAWTLATALAKHYDKTLALLVNGDVKDNWTHNKAIQKAVESYRITDEQKAYLRTLKRK